MGIIIQSDKISQRVKNLLAAGKRPDICIKTTGCRIGLSQIYYKASPDLTTIANDPNVLFISYLDYGRYCEKEADGKNYAIDFMATSVQDVLNNTSRDCSGSQQCPTCGGFPPAKGVVEQAVEGIYKLLTANPAILSCIAVSGPACPLVSVLAQAGLSTETINKLINIWKGMSVVEISNQIAAACRALGIPSSTCNATALANWIANNVFKTVEPGPPSPPFGSGPTPTGRKVTLEVIVQGESFPVEADEMSDGSYRVASWNAPVIGNISFSILFSTCQINITSGMLSGTVSVGKPIGTNACRFQIYGNDIIIKIKGATTWWPGDTPPTSNEQILIIGVIAFLALVGIILLTR